MRTIMILLCSLMMIPLSAQEQQLIEKKDMKTLIVYYSFTAGNTKRIAEKIQSVIGGDLVRLETVVPYPTDYEAAVSQGKKEVNNAFKPKLKPLGVKVKDYDRIIVGTPTWWYKMAPAVLSFLSENDFTEKVLVPYMTNAGWPGSVIKDMTELARKNGAKVENAHEFKFCSDERHYDRMETPETELTQWINLLK